MNNWSYNERLKTTMHEMGHALGLHEFNSGGSQSLPQSEDNTNVMVQGIRGMSQLGPCDKLVYYYKWEE